ncbi:MAG: VanW family protein [Fimbriimonas ginsengisoli]|uniref:VanW family protein n=1 Tax=Fimbriimonas ginsengisoli TaxID=1005039 RepID=A0A931LTA7_FIMGI|nr:VanW family protein [Fimbriimonas ginsengisoli]MBI3721753.1 VanW family protein [Fimbriimonas ginsengisoli]
MRRMTIGGAGVALVALAIAGIGVGSLPSNRRVGSYATTLEGRTRSQRHNARHALDKLRGCVIGPGETFSFNKRVGTYSRDAGYRKAPVSYNGQLIASWGGGVCQTSTTLYNAALLAGMVIVERHPHVFCPSYVPPGRDAAVAFREVDLRFRNPHPFAVWIDGRIEGPALEVDLIAAHALPRPYAVVSNVQSIERVRTFVDGDPSASARVRTSGKRGYDVAVYRMSDGVRELVSSDSYPAMHRVIEYR